MQKIRDLLAKPLVTAAVGFVIGLVIGLPILGWLVWPVKWVDAGAKDLRYDAKVDYLRMAADSYAYNQDPAAAQRRWKEVLPEKASADQKEDIQKALAELQMDPKAAPDLAKLGAAVGVAVVPGVPVEEVPAAETPKEEVKPTEEAKPAEGEPTATLSPEQVLETLSVTPAAEIPSAAKKTFNWLYVLLGFLCVLTLLVGGALVYFVVLKKGKFSLGKSTPRSKEVGTPEENVLPVTEEGQEAPISQFMSTYNLGDDLYDDSFSIDSPAGEFLGECGIGISETIGVGDPKKVTAFEVWLFDKNDIQTVTKVLMSEHAFNDPAMRQRMASKGEPVQMDVGSRILLETATLQLEARIVDMSYGAGALPGGSFFERMTLELAVWPKK